MRYGLHKYSLKPSQDLNLRIENLPETNMKFPIDRELQTKLLLLYKIGCNNFRDFFAAKERYKP